MRVRLEPIASVTPHPSNPRRGHDTDGIARSIRAYGWRQPIVVWDGDGHILAGHGRLLAAQQLGLDKVPVHRVAADELTPEQAAAYRIADNRSAEGSEWDGALLLQELDLLGDRLRTEAGFDDAYLEELRRREEFAGAARGAQDEDEVPEPPATPVTRPGDLWILAGHRLLCGDATIAADVDRLLAGAKPHLMITDPPYGVEYDANWRNRVIRANGTRVVARAVGEVANDDQFVWLIAWQLFGGDVAYVWHAGVHAAAVARSLEDAGYEIRSQIIWNKGRLVIGRGDYHWAHEPLWYAVRKGKTGHWTGSRSESTVWELRHMKSDTGHSTQKPVDAMRRPMINNSEFGDAVYDPFAGSSTSIIAAETIGRRCYAIEIKPVFVDLGVKRWEKFAAGTAVLEETGESFAEVARARAAEAPPAADAATDASAAA